MHRNARRILMDAQKQINPKLDEKTPKVEKRLFQAEISQDFL
ncbi:hypothetical protein C942_01457 [Photobacterium marinum]|uniref:Uncharacterized protein n=1 Tax=Photobacterium marinum TaxID=1056511 RepID=L8JGZ1_9GAMM|nr:hypothetical protein C942_01457 [Photobacterium marinum]